MFSVLKKLAWFFKENKRRYIFAVVALTVVNVIEIWPPKLIGMAIDDIHQGVLTANRMYVYIVLLVLAMVLSYIFSYIWQFQLYGGSFILEKTMRSKLMNHLLQMTPTFYQKYRTGNLMARGTNDLRAVSMTSGFGILTLIDSTMFMGVILLMMGFTISWTLTLASIIPLPILAFTMKKYGDLLHHRFTKAQDAFGDMNDRVLESIAGVRVIRAYVQEKEEQQRFQEMTEDVFEKNRQVAIIDAFFDPTIRILVGCSYIIGIVYGAYLVFQGEVTLGQLVTFNVYLNMLIWPMFAIGELMNIMQRGNASLDRVDEVLSYERDVKNKQSMKHLDKPTGIFFNQVSFTYPSTKNEAIKNISFSIEQGQTLGIVGKTGSGKTTVIRQLLRQYPLGAGEISVSGIPLEDLPIDMVLQWIGYVPQEHVLFSKTVRENILYGQKEATEEYLQYVIKLAALDKDIQFLSRGLDTIVGEKGAALSGGQKQRISIARAMAINPEILILDDSLSAVDAKTETKIIDNIRGKRKGKTTIITAHRLSAVQHADNIIVMDNGEIIQMGTHQELMEKGGWYKEQYEHQQMVGEKIEGVSI